MMQQLRETGHEGMSVLFIHRTLKCPPHPPSPLPSAPTDSVKHCTPVLEEMGEKQSKAMLVVSYTPHQRSQGSKGRLKPSIRTDGPVTLSLPRSPHL